MPDHATTLRTSPLTPRFGVEIDGLDLAATQADADIAFVRRQLAQAGVVLIRDQAHITPAQQITFSRRFGELERHVLAQFTLPAHPEIFVVSNIKENGRHIGAHSGATQYHSDLAYLAEPSLGSIFRCLECPAAGGETAFLSMAAAYEELPDRLRNDLDAAEAVYDYVWSYEQRHAATRGPLDAAQKARTPPISHPVVRTHPETGRPVLFLSDIWVRRISSHDETATRALLDDIMAAVVKPEFEYVHAWRPGDIVIWDNRATMHRACPYDTEAARRLMHRTTIKGERPYRART